MTGENSVLARERPVLVIGAGPGGILAARTLSDAGIQVVLVDENARPGGAITRHEFSSSVQDRVADQERLGEHVEFFGGSICHGFDEGKAVVSQDGVLREFDPVATIVAVGARERIRPLEGGLFRGVLACGGAQTLIKGSRVFPYRSAVVAGSGPLLLATASQLLDAGVRVKAVIEEAAFTRNMKPRLALEVASSIPGSVLRDGVKYAAKLLRHRVPVFSGSRVDRIEGDGKSGVTTVVVSKIARELDGVNARIIPFQTPGSRRIECESVVLGYGFVSATELVQQAGARLEWDDATRFFRPIRTESLETTIPGLYTVGDCAGVLGQQAAEIEGMIAATDILAKFFNLGLPVSATKLIRRRYDRVSRFQTAMNGVYPQATLTQLSDQAIVCRCEGVTRAKVSEAVEHGAADLRSVKLWTRAGMGICQGRSCQPILGDMLVGVEGSSPPRAQFPVRPLPFVVADRLAR